MFIYFIFSYMALSGFLGCFVFFAANYLLLYERAHVHLRTYTKNFLNKKIYFACF